MAHKSTRNSRTAWVVAVPLLIALVVSVVAAARHGQNVVAAARHGQNKVDHSAGSKTALISSSTAPYPGLSAAFVSAVNSTDVQIAPAGGSAPVTEESAATAAMAQLPQKSSASAAELVTLTNSQYPHGVLAWAVKTDPAGGYALASDGPAGKSHPATTMNFRVDFVDASTGKWLEGVEGYGSGL